MRRNEADLETTLAELEAFHYALSHDLRTPVGAILDFASILRMDHGDALGEEGRSHLQRIERNARKVTDMLDGLLQFSRIGAKELQLERTDVGALLDECMCDALVGQPRGVQLVEVGELPEVFADRQLLKLALRQVIENAVRFSAEVEHPRIEVRGERDGELIVYTIQDNGIGFDGMDGTLLFRAFERVQSRRDLEGPGIGLALAARALKRQGGRAWLESEAGKGTTVHLGLPCDEGPLER